MVMEVKRTHDKFYLGEDYKNNPKEYYKLVVNEMKTDYGFDSNSNFSLLDIGCETGSFLAHVRRTFCNSTLAGMDVMKELLEKVNDGIDGEKITAILGDISSSEILSNTKKYDVVTMLGVLSIFDDYVSVLDNVLSFINDKGTVYLFGLFNPCNLDVMIKSKFSDRECDWESGWNYISKLSIENYCEQRDLFCDFVPFELGIDIPKHEEDPLRSWTINGDNDTKIIVNGLQLVHHFYLVKIHRK